MDCKLIESDLTSFHFGAATEVPRHQLEAHLLVCPHCVGAFFAVKRAVEGGPEARPSAAAQVRLREAVEREFARPGPHAWVWGGAAAALVVAAALLGFFTHSAAPPSPMLPPAESSPQNIDSARPEPLNLDFI